MQKVYARGAEGMERLLAVVRRDRDVVFVCPIERFVPNDERASLEFAIGLPAADVRDERPSGVRDTANIRTKT
jgi:hypothetical protein